MPRANQSGLVRHALGNHRPFRTPILLINCLGIYQAIFRSLFWPAHFCLSICRRFFLGVLSKKLIGQQMLLGWRQMPTNQIESDEQ